MKLIFILLFVSQALFSQSLENLEGPYICETDGFFHLYEFKKRKLEVTLNFKDLFVVKHTIFYSLFKTGAKDSILVYKEKHKMERLDSLNLEVEKSVYYPYTNREGWHLWVMERYEGEKLFIKKIPSEKTLSKRTYESDPNLIEHIILTPLKD